MSTHLEAYTNFKNISKKIRVFTLGRFLMEIEGEIVESKLWGRDKTLQLIQFFITNRHQFGLHKEVIVDRIWDLDDDDQGNRDFKVALHGIRKVMEPNRKSRNEASYILRQGASYQLQTDDIWIDADAIDFYVKLGNQVYDSDRPLAINAYQDAIDLYKGIYLPNRLYEDWSSAERERLQIQALNTYMALGELILNENSRECIRLAQEALTIDNTWEEAYRLQMQAYINMGNRPQAIKVYNECKKVLDKEFDIAPLPQTTKVIENLISI
ncbi:MAG: transcriptional regulator [Saprospiraceae bacterium]|nr:bacterial transcriptional activator domain-containing protein [Bacteroidia bacterium]NNL93027.1 transcriptional regulator [Saprospiraceae bacterium]